jgi:hypothetical protein
VLLGLPDEGPRERPRRKDAAGRREGMSSTKSVIRPFDAATSEQADRYRRELAKATKQGMCSRCADQTARAITTGRLSFLDIPGYPEYSLCAMCERRLNPPLEPDGWKHSRITGEPIRKWRVKRAWTPPPKPTGPTKACQREGCGKEFAPLRRSARYCSELCKTAARRSKRLAKPEVAETHAPRPAHMGLQNRTILGV